jgi:diguanylate cyclase (GGDEF)-like protein/PAS domain S-box-containing protein
MQQAPLPDNEPQRLALLYALDLLDSPNEPVFDTLTRLAARTLRVPTALVSLLDTNRQWFKSRAGLDAAETPRSQAFCAHTILKDEPLVVHDARLDPRFRDNPLVTGPLAVRAYAGVPLRSVEGLALGTLCVLDQSPREFTADELATLADLADLARQELLRREASLQARTLAQADGRLLAQRGALVQTLFEHAAVGMAMVGLDGSWLRVNQRICDILGRPAAALIGHTFQAVTHPDDLNADLTQMQALLQGERDQYAMEKRYLRPDGTVVWGQLTVGIVREHGVPAWFVATVDDISSRKATEHALAMLRDDLERRVLDRTEQLRVRSEQLEAILENALDAFVAIDGDGLVIHWNRQAEQTFGWSRAEATGQPLAQLIIPPTMREAHVAGMAHMARTGEAPVIGQRMELPAMRRDGLTLPCEVTINTLPQTGGKPVFFAFLHDISARRSAQDALLASERRVRVITDNLPVLVAYVDREQRYGFCNATYRTWLGVDPAAAVGQHVAAVLGEQGYSLRRPLIERALAGEQAEADIEVPQGDDVRHLHLRYFPDTAPDGQVQGLYALATDVTETRLAHRQLIQLARTDALTGLPNRRAFEEAFDQAMARHRRTGRPIALAFMDIDRFKLINDTHGHGIGDEVLQTFALRLTSCVRMTDTVARLAGDEFVIILEGLNHAHEADIVARKILAAIDHPFELSAGLTLPVQTSIGIAYQARGQHGAQALLEAADRALYAAKAAGRNTHCVISTDAA